MIPAGFPQALADYATELGSDAVLREEREALFERIRHGEGGALVSHTVNGKTFHWTGSLTVEEKFQAFTEAIAIYNNTRVSTTYAAFSCLQR